MQEKGHGRTGPTDLTESLERLQPHDHLSLIYDSPEEWRAAVVPFIRMGLERGEKCMYIVDTRTADEVRRYLADAGVDVPAASRSGQLSILQASEACTQGGTFDPDRMIALLIEETQRAVAEGYPALRITGEMTWVLRGAPGSERLLEYEAKLNRDLFPHHPCLSLCQYDRWAFDPEAIKGVLMTHPKLIRGGQLHRNFYFIPPEELLDARHADREVEHWLNSLDRERETWEPLRERGRVLTAILEATLSGFWDWNLVDNTEYLSPAFKRMFGYEDHEMESSPEAWQRIIFPEDLPGVLEVFDRHVESRGQEPFYNEVRYRHKDGSTVWVICAGRVIEWAEDGSPVRMVGCHVDITNRKWAEQQIEDNEARMQSQLRILQYQGGSEQEFLDYALDEAVRLTKSSIGYIYFYSEHTRAFTLNSWSKGVMDSCSIIEPQTVYQLEATGIWGEAVRQRTEILVNDFQAPHPLKKGYPEGHAPLHRYLTVPVFNGDQIVAVVGVANKESNYERGDVLQLQLLMDGVWKEVERRRGAVAVVESEQRYRSLFENMSAGFVLFGVVKDDQGAPVDLTILAANERFAGPTGLTTQELIGKRLTHVLPGIENDSADWIGTFGSIALTGGLREFERDSELLGAYYAIAGFRPAPEQCAVTFVDITERKHVEQQLQYYSTHDPLTGAYNRHYFDEEMARLARGRRVPVSILVADLNGLKSVNDTRGHAAGDEVLRRAREVLSRAFRAEDVLARMGGDEFAAIFPETDEDTAFRVLERVRESIADHNRHCVDEPLSVALGVATAAPREPLQQALRLADARMYEDKTATADRSTCPQQPYRAPR